MQTLQQSYADSAYRQIVAFGERYKKTQHKEYGTMAHKLPVLVRQAGLIQALAYVATRGKESQKQLLAHLAATLGFDSQKAFITKAQKAELGEYMLLTRQTLWALEWYKRFAQSVLGVEPGEED